MKHLYSICILLFFLGQDIYAQSITRGPYLQIGTSSSIIIRWRTNIATDSEVRWGLSQGALDSTTNDAASTTEHEVALNGLDADTKYYYSVGTSSQALASGSSYYFITAPLTGIEKATRVWIIGDAGTDNANQEAVRDAYLSFTGSTETDLWIMLGDNAYNSGTDLQYQNAVFDMYDGILRHSVVWPAFGNHDGYSANSSAQSGVFYDIFTLPDNAQAGGTPSGTEAYYSFEYANVHFICLNSHDINGTDFDDMVSWLDTDLGAHDQDWTIAFWHHPPYSKGSHNSDSESQLIRMREDVLPVLESGGVDMVLSGHSHSYERSYLLDGHYGLSGTLTAGMILDGGDGRSDGDGEYTKATLGSAANEGTVYVVAGSSGQTGGGNLNHPAMYTSLDILGSVILDFSGDQLDLTFLDNSAVVRDYLTMIKGQDMGLPVFLSFFRVREDNRNKAVILEWQTSSELNNYMWQVQKRSREGMEWQTIAERNGQINSSDETYYSCLDNKVEYGQSYQYRLVDISLDGEKHINKHLSITVSQPQQFEILASYPNPFNPSTAINLLLQTDTHMEVDIYNALGKKVKSLLHGSLQAGLHKLVWDGTDQLNREVASGNYFIVARSASHVSRSRVTLIR